MTVAGGAPAKKKDAARFAWRQEAQESRRPPEAGDNEEIRCRSGPAPPEETPAAKRPVTIHVPLGRARPRGRDDEAPEADSSLRERRRAPANKKTRRGPGAARTGASAPRPAPQKRRGRTARRQRPTSPRRPSKRPHRPKSGLRRPRARTRMPPRTGDPDEDWAYVPMSMWGDDLK